MSTPAASQPSKAYGPGSFWIISGTVRKTPAPTICVTLSATACSRPKWRCSGEDWPMVGRSLCQRTEADEPPRDCTRGPGATPAVPEAGLAEPSTLYATTVPDPAAPPGSDEGGGRGFGVRPGSLGGPVGGPG